MCVLKINRALNIFNLTDMKNFEEAFKNLQLEDERVLLKPMEKEDHKNLLSFALHEPYLWKYSLVSAEGTEGLQYYMQLALDAKKEQKEFPFVVYDKQLNEFAGSTRYYDINLSFEIVQIGYTWYGKKFQGTGLNKHCKFLLLQFAFESLNLERVEFRADAGNEKSIAAMKSIGCKVDGILRANMPKREGGRRDSIVLSILKDEWFGTVKEALKKRL